MVIELPKRLNIWIRDDGKRVLRATVTFRISCYPSMIVPAGFVTDFSSVPWFGRWLVDWRKIDKAGILHDALYADRVMFREKNGQFCKLELTRKECDEIWRAVAIAQGVPCWKAELFYFALRIGGRSRYRPER